MKLFGKIISLTEYEVDSCSIADFDRIRHPRSSATTTMAAGSEDNNKNTEGKLTGTKQEDDSTNMAVEESIEPDTVSGTSDDNKTSVVENETLSSNSSKKEDLDDTSEEKTLKKPDKIVPCPRCHSMDTKFCYYNNYNVNQPRHFCKKCQRYWTAGGTMRNVPVGSGRRKNKNTATVDYHHIMISDALQAARADLANEIHIPTLKANGAVLTFGSEKPLCGSMVTDLNLAERSYNHFRNGFLEPEQRIAVPSGGKEIGKDNSIVTSSTTTNSTETGGTAESAVGNCQSQGYLSHVPPFPSPPWSYPWNAPQWRTPLPPPAFNHSGFPVSFYPAPPYWGCAPPGPWNMPWLAPAPSSSDNSTLSMSPTSPTLGKHSRDSNILSPRNLAKEEPPEKKNKESGRVLIPKTLRIDDPNESAKSSIWSTLGIKHDKVDRRTSLFKPFPSKADQRNHITDTSLVMQANPAAYSRSQSFQEST